MVQAVCGFQHFENEVLSSAADGRHKSGREGLVQAKEWAQFCKAPRHQHGASRFVHGVWRQLRITWVSIAVPCRFVQESRAMMFEDEVAKRIWRLWEAAMQ